MPAVDRLVSVLLSGLNTYRGLAVFMGLDFIGAQEVAACFDRSRFLKRWHFEVSTRIRKFALEDRGGVVGFEFHTDVPVGVIEPCSSVPTESAGEA